MLIETARRYGIALGQDRASQQMQSYLETHGALPGGWDNAVFRHQSNVFAWTLLRNTGRTNLTSAEFRALADDEWTATWAAQGNAALQDVYMRECSFWCRNKQTIQIGIVSTAVGFLTGGAAATAAPAAWEQSLQVPQPEELAASDPPSPAKQSQANGH